MAVVDAGEENASRRRGRRAADRRPVLVFIFLILLLVPLNLQFGPLRLTPFRIFLLLVLVPLLIRLFSGGAGRAIPADWLMMAHVAWSALALIVNHGVGQTWQPAGIFIVEGLGAYLLARVLIRSEADFRYFVSRFLLLMVPFALLGLVESTTGNKVFLEIFRPLGNVYYFVYMEQRWGLDRAQGPFAHPILFGMFAATGIGLGFYLIAGRRIGAALRVCAAPLLGVFFSLSSGAFVAVGIQAILMVWDRTTRSIPRRWGLFMGLVTFFYITIDLLSNRSPVTIFISIATFNLAAAWNRVLIWEYGTAEVRRHPIFGIGLDEWERAFWMSTSMDNFWLLIAVRYGLPSLIFLVVAIIWIMRKVGAAGRADPALADAHKAYLITLVGLMVGICTVHLWDAPFVLFMFLIGSGVWMIDRPAAPPADPATSPRRDGRRRRAALS